MIINQQTYWSKTDDVLLARYEAAGTEEVDDILEHFGVKGMQWGVRKTRRAEKKWEQGVRKPKATVSLYNEAMKATVNDAVRIGKKYKGKNIASPGPSRTRYDREVVGRLNFHLDKMSSKNINPSKDRRAHAFVDDSGRFFVGWKKIQHGFGDNDIELVVKRDFNGFITKISLPDEATMPMVQESKDADIFILHADYIAHRQGEAATDEYLKHFGVKGMQWGIRKARSSIQKAREHSRAVREDRPHKTFRDPKVAKGRTIFRTAPRRLTDEELQSRINRLEMEKKYLDLNHRDLAKGKKAVGEVLGSSGKTVGKTVAVASLTYAVRKAFETGGGKVGKEIAQDIKVKKKG